MRGKPSSLLIMAMLLAFAASGCSVGKKLYPTSLFGFGGKKAAERETSEGQIEELERTYRSAKVPGRRDVSPYPSRGGGPAEAVGYLEPFSDAVYSLTRKVESAFPPVEGYIVATDGGNVFLSVSARDGIRKGAVLSVIRQGDYFRHPLTDEILGRYEEDLGTVEVVEVRDDYSVGAVISGDAANMKRGDLVRITGSKILLAVLPITSEVGRGIEAQSLYNGLTEGLAESGRFRIFDMDTLQIWLLETGYSPDQLQIPRVFERLKEGIPAEYYLFTKVRSLGGRYVLQGSLIPRLRPDEVREFSAVVRGTGETLMAELPSPQRGVAGTAMEREGFTSQNEAERMTPPSRGGQPDDTLGIGDKAEGSIINKIGYEEKLRYPVVAMDVADVDGDGFLELIAAGRSGFCVLKYDDRKKEFETTTCHELGDGSRLLSLDSSDLNGNGLAEIYLVKVLEGAVATQVLEFSGSGFKKIAEEMDRFCRVIDYPRRGSMLVSQPCGVYHPFAGGVQAVSWGSGRLNPSSDGALFRNMKRDLDIFTFAVGDLDGDGEEDILEVDEAGYLRIYGLNGKFKWRSDRRFECHSLHLNDVDGHDRLTVEGDGLWGNTLRIPGRIIIRDLDEDGLNEVIIASRSPLVSEELKGTTAFKSSSAVILGWDGASFYEKWRTAQVPGYATSLNLTDIDHDGKAELIMSLADSETDGHEGRIIVFELAD